VLQAFVSRSDAVLRESVDWIARTGGEDFVLVLPETTLADASRVAQKLPGEQCLRVSKNIGVDRPHTTLSVHGALTMAPHCGLRHEIN